MLEVFLGGFGGGEEEATGHAVERGVVWVFHLDNPRFPPVHTGDGAHLHARGVRDVHFGADEGVVGTISPPLGGGGGGSWRRGWPLWPGGGGGLGGAGLSLIGGGGAAPSDEPADSKCHLDVFLSPVLVTGGWGVVVWPWGGGGFLFHRFLTLPITPHHRCPYPLILRPTVPHLP